MEYMYKIVKMALSNWVEICQYRKNLFTLVGTARTGSWLNAQACEGHLSKQEEENTACGGSDCQT